MSEQDDRQWRLRVRMAQYLGYSPEHADTWPMELLDRLIDLDAREGNYELHRELRRLMIK